MYAQSFRMCRCVPSKSKYANVNRPCAGAMSPHSKAAPLAETDVEPPATHPLNMPSTVWLARLRALKMGTPTSSRQSSFVVEFSAGTGIGAQPVVCLSQLSEGWQSGMAGGDDGGSSGGGRG